MIPDGQLDEIVDEWRSLKAAKPTLQMLVARCKGGVSLKANEHRSCYRKASAYLREIQERGVWIETDAEIVRKMIETDTIIILRFYMDAPVGVHSIYHYDLDLAVQQAIEILDREKPSKPVRLAGPMTGVWVNQEEETAIRAEWARMDAENKKPVPEAG